MNVTIHLHSLPALTLEAEPGRPARAVHRHPSCAGLSAGWNGSESLGECVGWLEALLPENGSLDRWTGAARSLMPPNGDSSSPHETETALWLRAGAELPGAVVACREGQTPWKPMPIGSRAYRHLTEADVGWLLRDEAAWSGHRKGVATRERFPVMSSLAGMRPKISLTAVGESPDSGWLQGELGQLNTWVVKLEHSRRLPGEAGVEAICQNALALAGLSASRTLSRVVDGLQCVLSERSDRRTVDGCVLPVHQEDYRQAAGMGLDKHRDILNPRDEWPFAYRMLPECEHDGLTRFLAASWLLAHSDLHRGNLGFLVSARADGGKTVSLAPAYDVSSAVGTPLSRMLEFPIAGQGDTVKIGVRQWMAHAKSCGLDEDGTLQAVRDVVRSMPDAFAKAVAQARGAHENIEQTAVDRRCAAVEHHVISRGRLFEAQLRKRAGRTLAHAAYE